MRSSQRLSSLFRTRKSTCWLLIGADEATFGRAIGIALRDSGYEVHTAASGEEALGVVADVHPDAVILDLGLPGIDGVEVLEALRAWTDVPVLVLSARHM